jgi:ubiquitin-conjugating enzyme E2 S
MLIEEDYGAFERRAGLWTKMYAAVPAELRAEAEEAKSRGETAAAAEKANRISKGKRRKAVDDIFSHDPEASENRINGAGGPSKSAAISTPETTAATAPPPVRGLGLNLQAEKAASDAMDLDTTPTQGPPPPVIRRTRKRYQLNPPPVPKSSFSIASSSFSQAPATPTPGYRPEAIEPDPITPQQRSPKRLRLTPPQKLSFPAAPIIPSTTKAQQQSPQPSTDSPASPPQTEEICDYSWLTWHLRPSSPPSPQEPRSVRESRDRLEQRRMKAAGGSVKRYNSGAFGPRKGILRL